MKVNVIASLRLSYYCIYTFGHNLRNITRSVVQHGSERLRKNSLLKMHYHYESYKNPKASFRLVNEFYYLHKLSILCLA